MKHVFKIGITGTRNPITDFQKENCKNFLNDTIDYIRNNNCYYDSIPELHHGDCVGADNSVAELAQELGFKTVCHPPIDEGLRAFHPSDVIRSPLTFFARNRAIVDAVDLLMVVPYKMHWEPKGGTWYTHDYAVKCSKMVNIFWPQQEEANLEDYI